MTIHNGVRVGILLPTREQAITGDVGMPALLDFARQVEDLGFDSLWTGDSLVARPRLDPMIVLAAASAVTSRITLGTAALTAALRHPLIGSNMAASLDHASGGRLVLGLGSGFPIPETEEEFGLVGASFEGRAGRLDEIVTLWRRAWASTGAGAATQFTGRYWQASGLDRLVRPARAGGPPLWLASSDTPKVLRRVARHYDGWLPFLPSPQAYQVARQKIAEHCVAAGRDPEAVVPALYATLTVNDDESAARAEMEHYVEHYYGRSLEMMSQIQAYGWGSASRCADWLTDYVRAGARHIVIRIGSLDPEPQLKQLGQTLLPLVREAVVGDPVA